MFTKKIAIDLGSSQTRIIAARRGLVVQQPSVVATRTDSGEVEGIGSQAIEMLGRTAGAIQARHPLRDGVIADFNLTEKMLSHFISLSVGRVRARRPEAMITVSSLATPTEKKAVIDAAEAAGLKTVYLIPSPLAAALGAGLPLNEPTGHMVIHIGAGTAEVAMLSLGGIVAESSLRAGSTAIDQAIIDLVRRKYSVSIGSKSAEQAKLLIGSALPGQKRSETKLQGRDLVKGLPKQIVLTSNELVPSIENIVEQIVLAARQVLEQSPPELVSDIMSHGIVLTGGGAKLKSIDRLFSKVIGVPVIIPGDPELSAVKGAFLALENVEDYQQNFQTIS